MDNSFFKADGKGVFVSDSSLEITEDLRRHLYNHRGIEGLLNGVLQRGTVGYANCWENNFYGLVETFGGVQEHRNEIAVTILGNEILANPEKLLRSAKNNQKKVKVDSETDVEGHCKSIKGNLQAMLGSWVTAPQGQGYSPTDQP